VTSFTIRNLVDCADDCARLSDEEDMSDEEDEKVEVVVAGHARHI